MLKSEFKNIVIFLLAVCPLMGLWSCEDAFSEKSLSPDVPVEFSFDAPAGFASTRGVDGYKKLFAVGDVIHLQAIFKISDGTTETAYGAMRLNESRKWEPLEGTELYWPFNAVTGTFKAYYVYGSNGPLYKGSFSPTFSLSDIRDDQDPLEALKEDVKYGNAVNMQFTHACTHLTLEKLDQNVTDYYWMVFGGEEKIKNAFQLSLDTNNELKLEFVSTEDPDYNNTVYISRRSETMTAEEDGASKTYSKASFYLAPGIYNAFELRTNNNFPYMSFINSIPGDEATGRQAGELQANHPYILNVEFAKGADYVTDTEYDWDEESAPFQVDVTAFLQAVAEGKDYTAKADNGEDVPILKKINGSLVLMRNLDFNWFKDYAQLNFKPDVSAGTVLEGNLHYIENIGHPVFRFNYGTIQNLGLKKFKSEVTAYEGTNQNDYANDFSRIGGLCLWNRSTALIHNIRMEDFSLTVNIKAEDAGTRTSNENFSIGMLCGDNYGTVSEVALKGDFSLEVRPLGNTPEHDYTYVDANLSIGGIIGNHSGVAKDIEPRSEQTMKIINTCKGREDYGSGVFCIGGAIGQSTGNEVSRVVMRSVTIDARGSDGYQQYIGGLIGRLRGEGAQYTVADCTVDGTLNCGTVSAFLTFNSPYIYMGGISGNIRGYEVRNCRAVCDLDASTTPSEGATYATGGVFGLIQSDAVMKGNSAYGKILTGLQSNGESNYTAHIGTFAGIARTAYSWDGLQSDGNTARSFTGIKPIGEFLESSDD